MELNDNTKKALVIFGSAFLLYLLLARTGFGKAKTKKAIKEDRTPIEAPTMNPKDAKGNKQAQNGFIALKAYVDAYNAGENEKALDELNREFAKEFQLRVYRRSSDKKLVVSDLKGNIILVNNG